jgi:acyl phosphate:glycerol-3-phosphate acyltransferase
VAWLLLIGGGYLLGSMPFGYWVVRAFKHEDIRNVGSGNIGATNVWRTYGKKFGLPVVLLDVLKGFVPALVGTLVVSHWAGVLAGLAAMVGHWRPLFLKFEKGGKMVATCGGAFFGVAPLVGLCAAAVWLLVFFVSRYASLASIAAAISLPLIAVAFGEPSAVIVFGAVAALAVVVLHRANIGRLFRGTENRFHFRRLPSRI